MSPQASGGRTIAGKARQVIARVRPGSLEGRRSLPIRRSPETILAYWEDPQLQAAVLRDIPAVGATLEIGEQDRDWGRTTTLTLELSAPVPNMATQALAGKAVRRLKALCETGEIPSSDYNPSARDDAGEPAS